MFSISIRQSDYSVELNRLLERNVKQSRCLDIESLCIRAGEKGNIKIFFLNKKTILTLFKIVWQIRVDLNVLNHDGNILDCANIALICALSHYRLPEVSVIGDQIKIVITIKY